MVSFSFQNLLIAPLRNNVQSQSQAFKDLWDLPLPIPLGLLLYPSVAEFWPPWPPHSSTESSSQDVRDLLPALFSSITLSSSPANSYSAFRWQVRWHFLQDASLAPWWDWITLLHAHGAAHASIPLTSQVSVHMTICLTTPLPAKLKISWGLGLSLSNSLSYFRCPAEWPRGYSINIC